MLLKVGRHLRPANHFKVIVARDDGENNFLEGYRKQFVHLRTESHEGPLTLIDGAPTSARHRTGRANRRTLQPGPRRECRATCRRITRTASSNTLRVAPMRAAPDSGRMACLTRRQPDVVILDARGLICPMPVIRTQDRMKTLAAGAVLDDPVDRPRRAARHSGLVSRSRSRGDRDAAARPGDPYRVRCACTAMHERSSDSPAASIFWCICG